MPISVDALTGALFMVTVELLLRGSQEFVSDTMRRLVCRGWYVGYAGALCAGGLLIPQIHCARHLRIISYLLRLLELFTPSLS